MKSAISLADAKDLTKDDIFDLEGAYVETVATTKRDNRQGYFHPSAVGMCGRRNVYEYISAPCLDTIDPKSLEIFDLGHSIHELVGRKLDDVRRVMDARSMGYEFRREVPYDKTTDKLFTDFGIGGTTDGLLDIWVDSAVNTWRQRSVLEIKSIKEQGFVELRAPKEPHVMQAHLYAFRFNCPIIYIWYYCKNNSERQVFAMPYREEILMAALKKYEGWLGHADAGTLPDREENYFECPRCEYREICQPSVLAKIRSKATGAALTSMRSRGRL